MLKMTKSTVGNIIKRYINEDRIDLVHQTGRPRTFTDREERNIVRSVIKNPKLSAPKLCAEVGCGTGKKVTPQTIRNVLKRKGFHGRVARKKPYVNERNRRKRLKFAKEFISKEEKWWKDVIFADESKFNVFGSNGRTMVWRKPNTEMEKNHLRPTVKHGGGSLMVWGCMAASGVGELVFIEGKMDKMKYLSLLKENLHKSAEKIGIRTCFKFYEDNDPKHNSCIVQEWLLYNCPCVLHPPPQSPDLNPIENLWDELDTRVHSQPISSKEHLKRRLTEEWAKIFSRIYWQTCKKYAQSSG